MDVQRETLQLFLVHLVQRLAVCRRRLGLQLRKFQLFVAAGRSELRHAGVRLALGRFPELLHFAFHRLFTPRTTSNGEHSATVLRST